MLKAHPKQIWSNADFTDETDETTSILGRERQKILEVIN
jgi:hypothetical protein